MADFGLFVGFGFPVRGREQKSAQIFNEAAERLAKRHAQKTLISAGFVMTAVEIGLLLGLVHGASSSVWAFARRAKPLPIATIFMTARSFPGAGRTQWCMTPTKRCVA